MGYSCGVNVSQALYSGLKLEVILQGTPRKFLEKYVFYTKTSKQATCKHLISDIQYSRKAACDQFRKAG